MAEATTIAAAPAAASEKITCQVCGSETHSIQTHLKKEHPEWTIERYKQEYPEAPLLSPFAMLRLEELQREKAEAEKKSAEVREAQRAVVTGDPQSVTAENIVAQIEPTLREAAMHELFDLGNTKAALAANGLPVRVSVMENHDPSALTYLCDVDRGYVFNIDLLKKVLASFELNMPLYLWGYHGTGKTTILQQVAARTRRPFVRVQHTVNMQESDVLGQWTVRDGSTVFQLGPLPLAMLNGWIYCADEYDFAMPSVTAVYQPVLEGQSLLIKDAPPHFRKIAPHPNFRFCATGNTNGTGDETGLYQGTMIQNAANYSRFQITEEVAYMDARMEKDIILSKVMLPDDIVNGLIKFAANVRESFAGGKIGMTISPRELIAAAKLSLIFGGKPELGLKLAFSNRLSRVDQKTVSEFAQRIFAK